jgi:hypothetical protein
VNFARTPELRITEPAGDVAAHPGTTITVRGTTAANARITVRGLRENPSVTADAQGNFEVTVGLVPGSNVIRLIARDPVTNRDSDEVARTVVVADGGESPPPAVVALVLTEPVGDATLSGPVPVAGTAAPGAQVDVTAVLVTAPTPTFSVTDADGGSVAIQPAAPVAPPPTTLTADAAGAFGATLALPAGTWDVSVAVVPGEPATRRVTIGPGVGLTGTLLLEGGPSYLEVDQDGVALSGVSGAIAQAGDSVPLAATGTIRIKAGNAGAVRVTIDGISVGAMGAPGAVVEWQITRSGV